MNPPYGERLGTTEEVSKLYRELGAHWIQQYDGWKASVLMGNLSLAKELPLSAVRKDKLRNGPLECRLLHFAIGGNAASAEAGKQEENER